METNKKFRLKRMAKSLMKIGYSCLIFFVFSLTLLIIFHRDWTSTIKYVIVVSMFISFFGSAIIVMFSGVYLQELSMYKRNIQIYRSRMFAHNVIEYLKAGQVQSAITEYTKCKFFPDKYLDEYIHGMLVMTCYNSDNVNLHLKGMEQIGIIQDGFNPQKIIIL